jgi:hypothetical protein
MALLDPLVCF